MSVSYSVHREEGKGGMVKGMVNRGVVKGWCARPSDPEADTPPDPEARHPPWTRRQTPPGPRGRHSLPGRDGHGSG